MKGFKTLSLLLLFLFFALSFDVYAVSMSPELKEKLKEEGRLEEVMAQLNLAREQGVWAPNPNPPLKREGKTAQVDTVKALVLLVDFVDNVGTRRTGEFDTLCFSKDFVYPTGSVRDYYWENSYQTLEVIGGAHGWFRMPQTYVYYTCSTPSCCYGISGCSYPHNAQRLVEDAINAADPYVNFADYDHDGNGWVDALFVIHAGPGAEQTGNCCHIWSHKWVTSSTVIKDGVRMSTYAMDPEIRSGGIVDIGVISHEFGHVLGAVDLYDYDNSSEGVGKWSIMASGSWNDNGHTPAHFDAWHKYNILGFSDVQRLTENQTNVEILQAETSPVAYRLWTRGALRSEYFLVENRQKVGFDSSLPGHGLLIYHVDQNRPNNDLEWCPGAPAIPHYKVALEQADGYFDLEGCYGSPNQGDAGDPFPGWAWIDKRAFDDTTMPGSRDYYDDTTQVAVWNISDSDSAMSANLDVTWSRPGLYLVDTTFDDMMGGDGDGRPEAGETVKLYFTISNIWLPITGTTVTGRVDTLGITFTDSSSFLGNIGTNGSANNNLDPMEFEVDSLYPGRPTIFTLHVEGNTTYGIYTHDFEVEVWAGNAEILLVDDDYGSASDYQSYYTDALDSLKQLYDIWSTETKQASDFSLTKYKYLIWYTGDHKTNLFTQAQVESLMSFLDHGGRLFLTSQDAAEVLSGSADPLYQQFLTDYLHVDYDGNTNKALVMGEPGDKIGDTLWIKPWGIPGANNQTSKDILVPDSQTDTVLVYADPGWIPSDLVAGTKFFNEDFKVVLFGFGFEAMTSGTYGGKQLSPRHFVMQRVLDWLKAPPTIIVMDPNGGEALCIGETYDILWDHICFEDSVMIEYSTNAGVDWNTIIANTANDGVHSWTIPNTPSTECRIRISDAIDGDPSDESDTNFIITPEVVSLVSPNGGEFWVVDDTVDITWTDYCVENVFIEYSINDGADWDTIVSSTPSDGSHPFLVPDTPSDYCLVRICDLGEATCDTSDDYFSIVRPAIAVMSPSGGDTLVTGSTSDIIWDCIFFEDSVKIEYSIDAGVEWSTIIESTTCDGFYSWDVPDTLPSSDLCLVRISDVEDGVPSDTSDYFTIISYVCGDANGSGEVDLADAVYLVNWLFIGGPPPDPFDAGDANGSGDVDLADAVYIVNWLFIGGPPPSCP